MNKEDFERAKQINKLFFKIFLGIVLFFAVIIVIVIIYSRIFPSQPTVQTSQPTSGSDINAQLQTMRNLFLMVFGILVIILAFYYPRLKKKI